MAGGLVMALLLASADVEVFIQHSDGDAVGESVEIFIEHSDHPPDPRPDARSGQETPLARAAPPEAPLEASARTHGHRAFLAIGVDPSAEVFVDGLGSARVTVTDRVGGPEAVRGDAATLEASLRVGVDTWRVTLNAVGQPEDPRASGFVFGFPVEGGVRLGDLVLGRTGVPFKGAAGAIAAFSLFGTARVELNGRTVAESAPLEVVALTTGIHADDDTHRRLPSARAGDLELLLLLPRLPAGVTPNGFLLIAFEDVEISVQDHPVPSARFLPTVPPLNPEDIGNDPFGLRSPDFRGAAQSAEAQDLIPLLPVALLSTPRPLNSAPAQSLPQGIAVEQRSPTPLHGGAVDPSSPAQTLPLGITVLQGAPQALFGGAVDPSRPAEAFVQGIAPLNAQPLPPSFSRGPLPAGVGLVPQPPQPSGAQVLPPVPVPTLVLPTLVPPATAAP